MNRATGLVMILIAGLAVARPAFADAKPKVWAVVVGVDRYDDRLIPPCQGATRDARAVARWFDREGNWGSKNVLRLDDLGHKVHGAVQDPETHLRPTLENLDWAVNEWLGHRVGPDDIVVIYFAGQAIAKGPRPGPAVGQVYLLPIDARAGDIPATGWSLEVALDKARWLATKKPKVVVWLDTATQGRGSSGLALEKGAPSGQDWLRALTRWPGVTAWLTADGRLAPDTGSFVTALVQASGTSDRAHNLLGTLQGVLNDPAMTRQGFQSIGGVGPGVSLWSGGALVIEEVQPELIAQSGHGDRVTSVLISADNARMITASLDSTVRVWSLPDRSLLRILADPMIGVEALALNGDGTTLMAGDGMGRLIGWDLTLDRPKSFLGPPRHRDGIVDLAFMPGGKTFVARDRGKRAIIWDASDRTIRQVGDLSPESISLIASTTRPDPGSPAMVAAVDPLDGSLGRLVAFDAAGRSLVKLEGPGGRISALALSRDGRRLAAGDDDGRVVVKDLPGGTVAWRISMVGSIGLLQFSKSGSLLIGDTTSLRLVEPRVGGANVALTDANHQLIVEEVGGACFSNDGQWLAACSKGEGRPWLWRIPESARVEPVALSADDMSGLSMGFTPDGRTLVVGDSLGGLKFWSLNELGGPPTSTPRPSVEPSRGRVAALSASRSGRYLLEITKRDDVALVWDLDEGRGCKALPGSWVAGVFLPIESRLVLLERPDEGGRPVIFDRIKREVVRKLEPPAGAEGHASKVAFGSLAVSKSGRWVAAASLESQQPIACVWRVEDGVLVHVVRGHDQGLTAVDISGDEATLLTASADGSVRLWPMSDSSVEFHRELATFRNPSARDRAITTARFSPTEPGRVLIGSRGGDLYLWDRSIEKKQRRVDLASAEGEVISSAFSSDGRWLAASWSLGKSIRFWSIAPPGVVGEPRPVTIPPQPHHGEQIGALASTSMGSMMLSGGDDSSVKFWDLAKPSLVGTLVAQVREDRRADWLAFTPEGLFDGSEPGEVLVKWRVGEQVITLQQSEDRHHLFQLTRNLAKGVKPDGPKLVDDAPRLKLEEPARDRASNARNVELTVWSGDNQPSALRLYQNGLPVRGDGDFGQGPGPNLWTTTVSLRHGENRFYAMASKPGAIDGRSEDIAIRYEGLDTSGRVHVLALGISNYASRPLKFAHLDAESLAGFLHSRGVQGFDQADRLGELIVLTDDQVTPTGIDDAFRKLRDKVAGKPEDTVVLFLAGHTDVDPIANQFCLLLPKFPFDPGFPESINVATRGVAKDAFSRAKIESSDVLPYSLLYNRLARLDALQRLVIIDACQAGAILEDSAVQNLQRVVDRGSRKARNSYLLAARRGEPANEANALAHGLLTYTLLRGMGAPGLRPIDGLLTPKSADLDGNGVITSDELVSYTNEVLPRIASLFPELVQRAGGGSLGKIDATASTSLEQKTKLQSAEGSFPLINAPR